MFPYKQHNILSDYEVQKMHKISLSEYKTRFTACLKDKKNWHTLLLYMLLPFLVNFILECFERKSFWGGFSHLAANPAAFFTNTCIILLTLSVSLLFRRRIFVLSVLSCVWIVFGISNFILLSNRVTPFTGYDLRLISSALGVLKKYLNNFQLVLIGILFVGTIVGLVFIFRKSPKHPTKVNYIRAAIQIIFIFLLTIGGIQLGIRTGNLEERFGELSQSYLKNGFVYCFTNSLIDTGVDKPADYSPESIGKFVYNRVEHSTGSAVAADEKEFTGPNVIFLQLESFFDVSRLKDTTFSEDPLPYFHSLKENYPSGLLEVPVIGAGTVNTEFEILTGMNMNDFGAGEYPYKSILKKKVCESIAYNLKPHGYATHAIHNHTGRFYSRNEVYANLGIDTYTSVEYIYPIERTPMNWCKDSVLVGEIEKCLNHTSEQDFICTISVQGHGSYPSDAVYEKVITAGDVYDEEKRDSLEYYVNQIHEMDAFLQDLIQTLSARNEETVLVMYGDHLPSLNINNENINGATMYQTDYVVWSNFPLNLPDQDLEAFELNSKVLAALGINDGVINSYHQNKTDAPDYLEGLAALEYDLLYGNLLAYDGTLPYEASEIQMGIDPIDITAIYEDPFNPNYAIIKGNHFTTYSKVYVNDERFSTAFIDSQTLRIKYGNMSAKDSFSIHQSKLSQTPDVLYVEAKTIFEQAFEKADFTTRQIIRNFNLPIIY